MLLNDYWYDEENRGLSLIVLFKFFVIMFYKNLGYFERLWFYRRLKKYEMFFLL